MRRYLQSLATLAWALCTTAVAAGCGDSPETAEVTDTASPGGDAADTTLGAPQVVSLRAVLSEAATASGEMTRVTCEATDAAGTPVEGVETEIEVRPDAGWRREDDGRLTGLEANEYEVTCVAPSRGIRGEPVAWTVRPGPAAETRASVTPVVVEAGAPVAVSCEARDEAGNTVGADDAVVRVSAVGAGVQIDDRRVTVTTAGRFLITCQLPGADAVGEAQLEVLPSLPDQLVATVTPAAMAYGVGAVVALDALVTDAYDNTVTGALLRWSSEPPLPSFGEGRFLAAAEGVYTLRVEVEGDTFGGAPLSAEAEILVDAGGPTITCQSPALGAMVVRDGPLTLTGLVADIAGVKSLTVDGQPVEVGADGVFSVEVAPSWGLNTHEIVSEDQLGQSSSTFCAYLAADAYLPEDATLDDAIAIDFGADAIDDGTPNQPLTSLTDILRLVLDSTALVRTLHESLLAANPVVPNECRQHILGWCALEVGAEYRGISLDGPNSLSATLVEGGLRVRSVMRNMKLYVKLIGDLDNAGEITTDSITVDITFGLGLSGGQPDVWVERTNEVTVGAIDSDFEGAISGTIIDLVFGAFEDTIRDEVATTVRDYLDHEVDAMLQETLASYDLASVGGSFSIPRLGEGAPMSLGLNLGWSTLDASPERLRIGLSAAVTGSAGQALPSLGVPLPPASQATSTVTGDLRAEISLAMLNQTLHRLWRGGLFDLDSVSSALPGLPEGTEIALSLLTPPAVEGVEGVSGGAIDIHMGPLVGTLSIPGLLDDPLGLSLTAKVRASVLLVDGVTLDFGGDAGLELLDLRIALDGVPLEAEARAALEDLLGRLVTALIDEALGSALPSLPIPDFALPEGFESYGVPAGTSLGLRDAELDTTHDQFIIGGSFGE